ncbi:hypothetical protein HYFRA_00006919 [Hymenoscyphus fraxineus]|uniref:DUF2264 domain protein n=1 Tax=Hymenoscyphus fraxineus TaxID=746836 RepID=A0A9N9KMD1_9HELO|nr:hypothetical protein HYFRA_00006919 [Hymenoscyphus fraxineus]
MPALLGFSDNPFQTRQDILNASLSLLKPLNQYKSPCGARIKLPTATGTGFDEIAAQMEGFARPLWVVADLLALESESGPGSGSGIQNMGEDNRGVLLSQCRDLDLSSWIRGLISGVDPESEGYWGDVKDHDQRMVEMEPISYALLTAPESFFNSYSSDEKRKITTYLRSINSRHVPPSNWRWFRVLVNLALVKVCGVPYEEVKKVLQDDLDLLDTFYRGEGWSSDGLWSEEKKQVDYYSGSFAIQYSQLAYVRFAGDIDPERCEKYCVQAREFAKAFWRFFDTEGAAIPFGRSLTYRFAFAAFWSAVVVAGVSLPPPLDELGVVKGLLLRHLRWWAQQKDIFNTDGTLNIGYTYPNMYMSEDYNSPQSVYWCFKTFSILRLSEDHPFWACEELPHPLAQGSNSIPHSAKEELEEDLSSCRDVYVVTPAMQIVCSSPEHHFLLSAGQFTKKTHKAREAKYSKFAYSSAFAFSVPVGNVLTSMAPDSTLSASDDDGETWKTRWEPLDARTQMMRQFLGDERCDGNLLPTLISSWRPWRRSELKITTTLTPPSSRWPGWHLRVHKLSLPRSQRLDELQFVDAGFAISCVDARGAIINELKTNPCSRDLGDDDSLEGTWRDDSSCLILSGAGACGVCSLMTGPIPGLTHRVVGSLLKPDANTNLMAQRTVIPTIHHCFELRTGDMEGDNESYGTDMEVWFVTGVFAVVGKMGIDHEGTRGMWRATPQFELADYLTALNNQS